MEVAKLAGVPPRVIRRARAILAELEAGAPEQTAAVPAQAAEEREQVGFGDLAALEVAEQLRQTDLNTLTPIEAMNLLYQLKQKL